MSTVLHINRGDVHPDKWGVTESIVKMGFAQSYSVLCRSRLYIADLFNVLVH